MTLSKQPMSLFEQLRLLSDSGSALAVVFPEEQLTVLGGVVTDGLGGRAGWWSFRELL